jgi:hypothetical protein
MYACTFSACTLRALDIFNLCLRDCIDQHIFDLLIDRIYCLQHQLHMTGASSLSSCHRTKTYLLAVSIHNLIESEQQA